MQNIYYLLRPCTLASLVPVHPSPALPSPPPCLISPISCTSLPPQYIEFPGPPCCPGFLGIPTYWASRLKGHWTTNNLQCSHYTPLCKLQRVQCTVHTVQCRVQCGTLCALQCRVQCSAYCALQGRVQCSLQRNGHWFCLGKKRVRVGYGNLLACTTAH